MCSCPNTRENCVGRGGEYEAVMSSNIKDRRTEKYSESMGKGGKKHSRFFSAGAVRAWVTPANPVFYVWVAPDPSRSDSSATPRAIRPLRAPCPPCRVLFFYCPSSSCRQESPVSPSPATTAVSSSQGAITPRLALALNDLHLQPRVVKCVPQHSAPRQLLLLHPTALAWAVCMRVCGSQVHTDVASNPLPRACDKGKRHIHIQQFHIELQFPLMLIDHLVWMNKDLRHHITWLRFP